MVNLFSNGNVYILLFLSLIITCILIADLINFKDEPLYYAGIPVFIIHFMFTSFLLFKHYGKELSVNPIYYLLLLISCIYMFILGIMEVVVRDSWSETSVLSFIFSIVGFIYVFTDIIFSRVC